MMWRIILILLIIFCGFGAELSTYKSPEELNNITSVIDYDAMNFSLNNQGNNQNNTFFARSIFKYADFLVFVTASGVNESINFGYSHPEYNYDLIYYLIIFSFFAYLIIPGLMFIIFLGYFGILIWNKSKDLIIKWRTSK